MTPRLFLFCLLLTVFAEASAAQPPTDQRLADRYLALLRRNPREGTAFQKVYDFHEQNRTINDFVQNLSDQAAESADGVDWMLIGLCQSQSNDHAAAAESFRRAESARAQDAMASYYLGRALVAAGQNQPAVKAFTRALTRNPSRPDQLVIYRALGRLHQRLGQFSEALEVWREFEAAFPGDARVTEDVARLLVENGQLAEARMRYLTLRDKASDPEQRVQFELHAAQLRLELGERDAARADLQQLAEQVKPGSWLHADIREQIDGSFLKVGDEDGLIEFYESLLKRTPDDLDGMRRLAQHLAATDRHDREEFWLQTALKKFPGDLPAREAMIQFLIRQDRLQETFAHFETLEQAGELSVEHAATWGTLQLQRRDIPAEIRQQQASKAWARMIDTQNPDVVALARVARLHRNVGMTDDALRFYRKAVQLAPSQPEYRESLGEYLHVLGRKDEAVAEWKKMASGERATAFNLSQLAETMQHFGYTQQAIDASKRACVAQPDAKKFLAYATLLSDVGRSEEALRQLELAAEYTPTPQQRIDILAARLRTLEKGNLLEDAIRQLETQVANTTASADDWHQLATYYEAAGNLAAASRAVSTAVERHESTADAWETAARIRERSGMLSSAITALQKLIQLKPAFRTEYLTRIVDLQTNLGQIEHALATGEQLIAAAPENPEHYRFVADLAVRLGRRDLAIRTLRKAIRINGADVVTLRALADSLKHEFLTGEAIDIYWEAFEADSANRFRLQTVRSLAELYLRIDDFETLISRLKRRSRSSKEGDDFAVYLAKAHESAGRPDLAIQALQRSSITTTDPEVWSELSALAEQAGDFAEAAEYQRQQNHRQPSVKGNDRLANLLLRVKKITPDDAAMLKFSAVDRPTTELLAEIDRRIQQGEYALAARQSTELMQRTPDSWATWLRVAVVAYRQQNFNRVEEAVQQILTATSDAPLPPTAATDEPAFLRCLYRIQNVRQWLEGRPGTESESWNAIDVQEARALAILLRVLKAVRDNAVDSVPDQFSDEPLSFETVACWDAFFAVEALNHTNDQSQIRRNAIAERFRSADDAEFQAAFLYLAIRQVDSPPSTADMVRAFEIVRKEHPQWLLSLDCTTAVVSALRAAGERESAQKLLADLVRQDASKAELLAAFAHAMERKHTGNLCAAALQLSRLDADSEDALPRLGFAAWVSAQQGQTALSESLLQSFLREKIRRQSNFHSGSRQRSSAFTQRGSFRVYVDRIHPVLRQDTVLAFDADWNLREVELLLNFWQISRKANDVGRLLDLIRELQSDFDGAQGALLHKAMAHILFLDDQTDRAALHLVQAAEQNPNDAHLRLRLAQFFADRGFPQDAQALLQTVSSAEHDLVVSRETLALKLATESGDKDAAKRAGEVLFGLRLPPKAAEELAEQMNKIGLQDLAAGVEARYRQNTADDIVTLSELLKKRVAEENHVAAAEIAHQILRQTAGMTRGPKVGDSLPSMRRAAIRALNQAGRLEPMLQQLRDQLSRVPDSIPVHETLLEYYAGSGQSELEQQTRSALERIRPVTVDDLLKQAEEFENSRDFRSACETLGTVLRRDPGRFSRNYYQYLKTFTKAGELSRLADVLLELDLGKLQNNHFVVNEVIQTMLQESGRRPELKDQALELFAAAWDAFPGNRTFLVSEIENDEIWKLPLMVDYAGTALVPQNLQESVAAPWKVISGKLRTDHAEVSGNVTRLLGALRVQDRVAEFTNVVQAAVDRFSGWYGGQLLLAILKAELGERDQCVALLTKTCESSAVPFIPADVAMLVTAELDTSDPQILAASIRLMEVSLAGDPSRCDRLYDQSPGKRLTELYLQAGQNQQAMAQVQETLRRSASTAPEKADRWPSRSQQQHFLAGRHLLAHSRAIDAWKCFDVAQETKVAQTDLNAENARNLHAFLNAVREHRRRAESGITVASVLQFLQSAHESQSTEGDYLIYVDPQTKKLESVLWQRLLKGEKTPATDVVQRLSEFLNTPEQRVLPIAVAAFLVAQRNDAVALQEDSVAFLSAYLDLNTDKQTPTTGDVVLWFVARECDESLADLADRLTQRAEKAAMSSGQRHMVAAMLNERAGQLLEAGRTEEREAVLERVRENERRQQAIDGDPQASESLRELRARLLSL